MKAPYHTLEVGTTYGRSCCARAETGDRNKKRPLRLVRQVNMGSESETSPMIRCQGTAQGAASGSLAASANRLTWSLGWPPLVGNGLRYAMIKLAMFDQRGWRFNQGRKRAETRSKAEHLLASAVL